MRWKIIIPASIALVACVALPLTITAVLVRQAEVAAAARAYCVQVAREPFGYRAAASLQDLSVYTMRARRGDRGLYPNFHAVLFAARADAKEAGWGERVYERFNWSYRQLRFLPISGQGHATLEDAPECVPVPGFALALPFLRMRVR
jgi:hypothetical protein